MEMAVLTLFNGISYGMLLFLIASGMSIVMGLMGIVNLAHGALYMVGAYVGWTIAVQCGLHFGLAIFLGGIAAALTGLMMERGFLRRLYKQPNEQVLVTFGFVYILSNLCSWVWGPRRRLQFTGEFLSGLIHIGGIPFPMTRVFIIIIGALVAIGLWWIQDKTRLGAMVRGGMDDKEMTAGLGINLERVSMLIFFLSAFIVGIAGVVGAQLLGAYSWLSTDILVLALVVVIVGGMGSVQGALLGGILIGLIDTAFKTLFPQFSMFTIYLAMIVILMVRPSGLLGRRI
ncbi:High-affinity branched-chain amino acid transport system permease protein LivH [subsurface metagenome]